MYKTIFFKTFDAIFNNADKLILKLLIPTILIIAINFFIPQITNTISMEKINDLQNIDSRTALILFSLGFITIMANISIAITTHRVAILGAQSVPKFGSFIFGFREFKILLFTILFFTIILVPVFLLILIPVIGGILAILVAIILSSRLSLIFPAIACDENFGIYDSWRTTKKHNILVIVMAIIFPILFSFIVSIVYSLVIEFLIKLISPHFSILYSILNIFITVFCVSAISSLYNYLNPKPLNNIETVEEETRDIIQISNKDVHEIVIHDKHKTDFESLKNELYEKYKKLGFNEVVFDRSNSWILKTTNNDDAYVSIKYINDEYTIIIKNTIRPNLSILRKNNIG